MRFHEGNYAAVFPGYAEHIKHQISSAKIATHPFPHLYVNQIFPDALYDAMEIELPSRQAWDSCGNPVPHFDLVTSGNAPIQLKLYSNKWFGEFSGYIDLVNKLLFE